MIAAIKAQTDALERLPQAIAMAVAEAMKAVQPPIVEVVTKAPETPISPVNVPVQYAQQPVQWTVDSPKTVVIEGRVYDSPKLFAVIDWIDQNPDKRDWSVRQIADATGVSKSWVAVAKKYKKDGE